MYIFKTMYVHTPIVAEIACVLCVPCVHPNSSYVDMYFPNGGASDLGVAGYAQDGSVAGCSRRRVTSRYSQVQRYKVQI